ncbi:uncharacterized protein LOC111708053 isoform X2 [Eurytemora carolleeae]|uniref:uncharacterized protein LOC111708053 isoform X2 n=1 Tax=Eurytemora carolleeae TaxID=1294199 RepID=UPI000C782945|nr:uncharacterized protein LOC111708053 isoform X2 [Eurytemora carolleeae]|eukprot:XP_023337073.1 uncharacterized protein LOC111708053 isoform X2 [Eurytemora affinis]
MDRLTSPSFKTKSEQFYFMHSDASEGNRDSGIGSNGGGGGFEGSRFSSFKFDTDIELNTRTGQDDIMPKSPGISKNQDLKDRVLLDVYNRVIRDLKSS